MAWFEKKKPESVPVEPTAEEKAAAELKILSEKVMAALKNEPAFKVMTVDGLNWIDPYTMQVISAPFDYIEAALDHLLTTRPWLPNKQPHPVADLQLHRWLLYLREQMEFESALRTFASDGRWLNPFNAQWVPLSKRGGAIDAAALAEMATVLMKCPEAQAGKLLDHYRLQEVVRLEVNQRKSGTMLPEHNHATTRISGSRASQSGIVAVRPTSGPVVDEDLDKAERILDKLLAPLPAVQGFGFTLHYEPHSQVGGDFYECQEFAPGRFFLALGDVSGHGVQGALVVVAALKSLRYILKTEKDLVTIIARLNDEVKGDLVSGQFITMFAGILDAETRTLQCVCAGHHPAVMISRESEVVVRRIGSGGAAIGLLKSEMFKRTLKPVTVEFQPGDTMLMYTDGLSEVHNFQQVEFGDYRVIAGALNAIDLPYDEIVRLVVREARQFASGVMHDDVTVISLSIDLPKEEGQEQAPSG